MIISNSYERIDTRRQEAFFRALSEWWADGRPEIRGGILNDARFLKELMERCLYPVMLKMLPVFIRMHYSKEKEEALSAIRLTLFKAPYIYIEHHGVGGAINYFSRAAYFKLMEEYERANRAQVVSGDDIERSGGGHSGGISLFLLFLAHSITGDAPILEKKGVVVTLLKGAGIGGASIARALQGDNKEMNSEEWRLLLNDYFPYNPVRVDWSTVMQWFEIPPPQVNEKGINRFFIRFTLLLKNQFFQSQTP